MPTSLSYNHTKNRDQIITRSLRIIGAIGQGETPTTQAITEATEALNDMVKEFEADGMQLWCIKQYSCTYVAGTNAYTIGVGSTVNQLAPTKIIQAWNRANNLDSPILIVSRQEYNMLGAKTTQGTPSQLWYNPPGEISATETQGTLTFYVTPDANSASNITPYFTGVRPLADFDSSTDVMDFPQYWGNAVVWGLASQLSYEYGVGLSERQLIERKADRHRNDALSYGTEEGSFTILPMPHWTYESY